MSIELFFAMVSFAFVGSITPGPNNLMLMASGTNFGFRRTVPHMLGVGIGFSVMVPLVGVGLMQIFDRWPATYLGLKVVSVLYLLWLAWKIAQAGAPGQGKAGARPLTFWQAAAFQWVNPKAWFLALTAITAYAPDRSLWAVAVVSLTFAAITVPTVSSWTLLGQEMRRILSNPRHLSLFNWTMAGLLVASLLPVVFGPASTEPTSTGALPPIVDHQR